MPGLPSVTLVTPGFPPDRGGVEAHTGHLARELVALGVRVRVLTARRGLRRPVTEVRDGMSVTTYPAWRTTVLSVSPRLTLAGLFAARTDVVHVHSYHALCGFAVLRGLVSPVLLTPHYHGGGHSPQAERLHRVYRFVGRLLFRAARAVICVSRAERDAVVRDFPRAAGRVAVIPNAVDAAAIRAAQPVPDQPRTVVSLGRLEPYKRVDVLVRAAALLPADTQVVIIGDGGLRAGLEQLAVDLGVADRVRFLGALDTAEVHRWLRTASVLASLSAHEAFGMAPLEAAAAGARVALSDIAAHREIRADYLGAAACLVEPEPTAVAALLTRLLAATGRVSVDVPDWGQVAERTLTHYRLLTSRKDTGWRARLHAGGASR